MQKHKNTDNKKCHIDECKLEMKSLMTATCNISNSMFPSLYHINHLRQYHFLRQFSASGLFGQSLSTQTWWYHFLHPRSSHATHPTLPEPCHLDHLCDLKLNWYFAIVAYLRYLEILTEVANIRRQLLGGQFIKTMRGYEKKNCKYSSLRHKVF